jgi:hypothetical protein
MAEKEATQETEKSKQKTYTFEDAMKVADDIFSLQKEEAYHPGAFVHGLIFALEATQQSYQIPPQQLAEVKRSVRKYIQEVNESVKNDQLK